MGKDKRMAGDGSVVPADPVRRKFQGYILTKLIIKFFLITLVVKL